MFKHAVLILGVLLLASCAPKVAMQTVPVSTDPVGAELMVNGKPAGTTPCQVSLERNQDHILTVTKEGYRPQDVNYVITSHYHFDHCGGHRHLSEACTVCHALEYAQCGCPQPFEVLGYSDMSFHPDLLRAKLEREGKEVPPDPEGDIWTPRVDLVTGDQEIAKGIHLIETPGHTAGHYSLLVELAGRRPMLFTGDAVYTRNAFDNETISSFHLDPVKAVQSVRKLKNTALKWDAEVFVSHDLEQFGHYRIAPNHYS